jgi:hypothetical protein
MERNEMEDLERTREVKSRLWKGEEEWNWLERQVLRSGMERGKEMLRQPVKASRGWM